MSLYIRRFREFALCGCLVAGIGWSAESQDLTALPLLTSQSDRGVVIQGAAVLPFKRKLPREVASFIERSLLTIEAGRLSEYESSAQGVAPVVSDVTDWLETVPIRSGTSKKLWDMALVNSQGLTRRLRIEQTILPISSGPLAAKQLFREFLTIKVPQPLVGYSWLTFRMKGDEEDAVWVSAPTFTKQVRQVSGSNRDEPLVPSGIAPDEFGVFAGKITLIGDPEIQVDTQMVAINRRPIQINAQAEGGCSVSNGEPFGRWNLDGQQLKDSKPWSPTDAVFSPRKVVRVRFAHGDPQSDRIFEEVVIDLDTRLPVYRTSYGSGSTPLRVVVGTLGFRETADRTPTIVSEIVFAPGSGDVALLGLRQIEVCEIGSPGFTIDAFDPAAMDVAVATTPAVHGTPPPRPIVTPAPKERVIGSGRSHVVPIPESAFLSNSR